jgi:hypothetical protein
MAVAVVAAIVLLLPMVYALLPARNSAFSIAATTDVALVEPACQDQLTWDLPMGWVVADNAPLEDWPTSTKPPMPVTVELGAGGRAVLRRDASGIWKIRFTQDSGFDRCKPAPPSSLRIIVGGEQLPTDPSGYTYQSTFGEKPAETVTSIENLDRSLIGPAPPLALRIAGRVVLGQPMSEGGGWGGGSQPILHSARVEVRDKAYVTNQSLIVIAEDIGAGGLIDTHACVAEEGTDEEASCVLQQKTSATGFLQYPTGSGEVLAQVHRSTDRIGVVPFGGVERKLGATNWSILVKSPVLQSLVAALLLASALLQGVAVARDLWPKPTARGNDPVPDDRNEKSLE